MQRNAGSNAKIRNLDELQEADPTQRPSRLGAFVLASLGGACVVLAAVMVMKRPSKPASGNEDPLGALVDQSRAQGPGENVEVTFPKMLAGNEGPTTALESYRAQRAAEKDPEFQLPPGSPTEPPPAADRLPVMPLPAQHLLADAGKETSSADVLSSYAKIATRDEGAEVSAGKSGGFQLQVSSFKTDVEAQGFAAALRRRGHHAYVESADVKGRGVWHRVRIGPFKYKRSAETYRQEFEAKERMVTFIVSPPKTKVRVADSGHAED
ncbi:MAG: SPOR domain-containing protein [Polyangiaceae bacterium]|jgi:DedD protein|nr:SPOR domain-containing protein [Polyangiaceae bacterium]MBK8940813.1 SPOR domain-containing protein [Polyangiaceae bacterium]